MFFKKRNKYTITCLRCLVFMSWHFDFPILLMEKCWCYQLAICAFHSWALPISGCTEYECTESLASACHLIRTESDQHSARSRNGVLRTWTWEWVSEKSREEIKSSFPLCFPLSMHACLKFHYPGNLLIFAEMTEGKIQLKPIHHKISTNLSSFITKE